jgi:AcrR family transcriptional regulator
MTPIPDGRRKRGQRTHREILGAAVDVGSREGLEALTIGRLAAGAGVSKSGLFAHFGSKRELQLATIESARNIFVKEVIEPALSADEGLPRLRATLSAWLDYFRRDVFPGGCFFQAASLEFDGRPGPVRDRVLEVMSEWLAWLTELSRQAGVADGEAAEQIAFELNAIGLATNWQRQLLGDDRALDRAEAAFERLLEPGRPFKLLPALTPSAGERVEPSALAEVDSTHATYAGALRGATG